MHFKSLDRAICDSAENGFIKIFCNKGSDKIVGATVVGGPASELIAQINLAMTHKIGLSKITDAVTPYPSYADAIRYLSDEAVRRSFTPTTHKFFSVMRKMRL